MHTGRQDTIGGRRYILGGWRCILESRRCILGGGTIGGANWESGYWEELGAFILGGRR